MTRSLMLKYDPKIQKSHCCAEMTERANFWCKKCKDPLRCSDKSLYYSAIFDEYGIINQLQSDVDIITYCPWCGCSLPKSRRDEWFDKMESLGIDPWSSKKKIPAELMKAGWWK